ncbi:28S ribosomal protein S18a, mitochondrial-like [Pomacea canaliculata]|uniref:28S ribosomal protein S18a, mitochondrial-like n=1 Tax=Pomacea canaliculata TaxID=400727 RepID=UPI000D73CCB8|nr:28S ribosomal protein S18a, mitochondrial-like [Pomacea canaliculata]
MLRQAFQNFTALVTKSLRSTDLVSNASQRPFSVSSVRNIKEIIQTTKENVTTIEGVTVQSERAPYVAKNTDGGCTLCKIHSHLKYTDVLILSQFLRPDGCLLPRSVTGVCQSKQRKLAMLVRKAQQAGLLPQLRPELSNGRVRTGHKSNYKWKRYNVYFKD